MPHTTHPMPRAGDLLKIYDDSLPTLQAFTEKLRGLVAEILTLKAHNVHSVTGRTKSRTSLESKLTRGRRSYRELQDVTDLCGIRIITYFENEVDKVADIITDEFDVDTKNSIDKRAVLDPDRFGYLSLHFVVSLRASRAELLEYSRFRGMKAEIQIRSILQHAWAEIEHDLGYKTPLGVPRPIRREFSRLAGLLEVADKEFSSIRDHLREYERDLAEKLATTPETVPIDKTSLGYYIATTPLVSEMDCEIAAAIKADLAPVQDYEWDAGTLQAIGVRTVGQLRDELLSRRSILPTFGRAWVEQIAAWHGPVPVVSAGVSLIYLAFLLVGEQSDPAKLSALQDRFSRSDKKGREQTARDIAEVMKRLAAMQTAG